MATARRRFSREFKVQQYGWSRQANTAWFRWCGIWTFVPTCSGTSGRNFAEILRLLDSVQLTANEMVATPANWQQGDDVIILPAVSDEAAKEQYPDGWQQPLPYIRIVPQPGTDS